MWVDPGRKVWSLILLQHPINNFRILVTSSNKMVCRNYNYGNTKIQDTFGSPELIVNPAVAQKKSVTRTSLSSAIDPNTLPIPQGQPKEFGKLIVKEDSNSFQVGLLYLVYYHYLPLYFVCVCVGCSH